jgi:hypothetical protein
VSEMIGLNRDAMGVAALIAVNLCGT